MYTLARALSTSPCAFAAWEPMREHFELVQMCFEKLWRVLRFAERATVKKCIFAQNEMKPFRPPKWKLTRCLFIISAVEAANCIKNAEIKVKKRLMYAANMRDISWTLRPCRIPLVITFTIHIVFTNKLESDFIERCAQNVELWIGKIENSRMKSQVFSNHFKRSVNIGARKQQWMRMFAIQLKICCNSNETGLVHVDL